MTNLPIIAGTLASMLHVISGPDHLAAVTPLAIDSKKKAWKIGLFWGIGHLLGMLIIGVLFLIFKDVIPVESISGYSEQMVAIVLIGIGLWAIYRIFYKKKKQFNRMYTRILKHTCIFTKLIKKQHMNIIINRLKR